jgi:hypothetical protein
MAVELACWIDHLIYAHPDLDAAVATLHRLFGVEASGGGNHPGRGGVEGITQGGLVEWALAVEDIEAAGTHARSHGSDPGPVVDGHREDAADRLLHWRSTANPQVAGLIPFLISWGDTATRWSMRQSASPCALYQWNTLGRSRSRRP